MPAAVGLIDIDSVDYCGTNLKGAFQLVGHNSNGVQSNGAFLACAFVHVSQQYLNTCWEVWFVPHCVLTDYLSFKDRFGRWHIPQFLVLLLIQYL